MKHRNVAGVILIILFIQFAGYAIFMNYNITSRNVLEINANTSHSVIVDVPETEEIQHLIIETINESLTTKAQNTSTWQSSISPTSSSSFPSTVITINMTRTTVSTHVSKDSADIIFRKRVSVMLKKQLELNTTSMKVSVKRRCQPMPTSRYACVYPNCTQLSSDMNERVKSLYSQKRILTKAQEDLLKSIAEEIPENDVILLTAVSTNHFNEMQAMFHTLHTVVFPEMAKRENFSMVLWDLGLSPTQRSQMEKCCRCQVVRFPFDKFPNRMRDLHCYMWKPLAIRMTQMRARKYAMWQDASIRYTTFPGPVIDRGMQHGLQLLRQKGGVSIPHRTLPETFAFLGQNVCSFYQYPEIASGFGIYKNDPFILTAVTNPWARCGFEQDCMCPRHSGRSHRCYYGPCHRFDQSALSIITATLYNSEVYRILLFEQDMKNYFWVGRNSQEPNYFNSTGCLSR